MAQKRKKALILGAAGRDFHNFNVYFRKNESYRVVAFTATQIPDIENRSYPPALAGRLYPKGIPIFREERLGELIDSFKIDQVIHAYSDSSHEEVMHCASISLAAGADFRLMGPGTTSLKSKKPVVAVCAVRTGAGKSPTSQFVVEYLSRQGLRVAVVRHPMPYGDLAKMEVQCFRTYDDFDKYKATVEEREEYEPYVRRGISIWAGVDYQKILRRAERESDVILWDGGNNDIPFFHADLHITLVDPHRPGHEIAYHPGETNLRMADVVLISKSDTAAQAAIDTVRQNIETVNPKARMLRTKLKISAVRGASVRGKKVIVVEDGPTLTHGGMTYGAGTIFAKKEGARIVDPSPFAVGSIRDVYRKYPHLHHILPAMGYSPRQFKDFEATINRTAADCVVDATPVDLGALVQANKPIVQLKYSFVPSPAFNKILERFAKGVREGLGTRRRSARSWKTVGPSG